MGKASCRITWGERGAAVSAAEGLGGAGDVGDAVHGGGGGAGGGGHEDRQVRHLGQVDDSWEENSKRAVRVTPSRCCLTPDTAPKRWEPPSPPRNPQDGFTRTCCIVEGERGLPGRQATQHVRPLRHGRGRGVVVHLLGRDVVVDDGLAVLHGGRVWVPPDEVRGVEVGVRGAGGQVPRQVVSSSWERRGGRNEAVFPMGGFLGGSRPCFGLVQPQVLEHDEEKTIPKQPCPLLKVPASSWIPLGMAAGSKASGMCPRYRSTPLTPRSKCSYGEMGWWWSGTGACGDLELVSSLDVGVIFRSWDTGFPAVMLPAASRRK